MSWPDPRVSRKGAVHSGRDDSTVVLTTLSHSRALPISEQSSLGHSPAEHGREPTLSSPREGGVEPA
eukprot:2063209-Rhodomonas_salina.2